MNSSKSYLFLLFLLLFKITLNAQYVNNQLVNQLTEQYISVEYYNIFTNCKTAKIFFNSAPDADDNKDKYKIKDANGTPICFKTRVALFNFMFENGYEFQNSLDDPILNNAFQFLFKKRKE